MNQLDAPLPPFTFPREISREALAVLPVRRYEGEVVMVASPQDFDRAWEDLAQVRFKKLGMV